MRKPVLDHRATSRQTFVTVPLGVLRNWLQKAPGFYTFEELIFDTACADLYRSQCLIE